MERPAQRYFCNKCGYVGNVDLHPGCGYLAYHLAPFEQNYIDQLEKELADIKKLATSPASVPVAWIRPGDIGMSHAYVTDEKPFSDWIPLYTAAPTTPVSEDRNKLELYGELLYAVASKFPGESRHQTALRYIRNAEKGSDNATTQEDKP